MLGRRGIVLSDRARDERGPVVVNGIRILDRRPTVQLLPLIVGGGVKEENNEVQKVWVWWFLRRANNGTL